MMEKAIIAAMTEEGVIGRDGGLPWHLPEDMKIFKNLTTGNIVLMGRKTYESIPEKYRPLPDRTNIVLSRSMEQEQGVEVAHSIDEAVKLAERHEGGDLFVAGGSSVYAQALPLVDKMYISRVKENYEGDTYFPEVDWDEWREVSRMEHEYFTHVEYERRWK